MIKRVDGVKWRKAELKDIEEGKRRRPWQSWKRRVHEHSTARSDKMPDE